MHKLHYTILLIAMLVSIKNTKAQIPVNDPGWNLQPGGTSGGTEEFNSSLDFTTKWIPQYPWGDYVGGAEIEKLANLIQTTGTTLKIKADTLVPSVKRYNATFHTGTPDSVTIVYQGGLIQSRSVSGNEVYKFGYLEISAKYPGNNIYPLWPAFWLWSSSGCSSSPLFYNEIDICENGADESSEGHTMGTNVHWSNVGSCNLDNDSHLSISGLPQLSSAFHKYAIEWAPDRIIWYFDDAPVRTIYDATGANIPQHAMAVVLNFAISQYYAYLPSDWNSALITPHGNKLPTSFPQYFEIDYLRYYKLNTDCNTDLTLCTPSTDYSSRAVKRTITIGGSCSPTFNPTTTGGSYTLRATNYVILDAGTTINPTGTGYFAIETMPCQ